MVSSPATSTALPAAATTSVAASRHVMANNGHTNDSCSNATLKSPCKLHMQNIDHIKLANLANPAAPATPPPPFATDRRSPARAAKFSCCARNFREQIPNGETGWKAMNEMNPRKRKAVSKGKMKADGTISDKGVAGNEHANSKRSKPTENCENENGGFDNETEKRNTNQKPLKDYIRVRARRGEATDSHSLAERVRREKINLRMKLLQDLVPGCNKVIGKAVMLDEVIDYIKSLQRQVEFLAMKLAAVNPGLDFKNTLGQSAYTPQETYHLDSPAASFNNYRSYNDDVSNEPLTQCLVNTIPLDAPLYHNVGVDQLSSVDAFGESLSQLADFCDDDLHRIVQMGFGQNPVNFPVENQTSQHGS